MKKVSVIIPVYNVEQFVSECIESVLNQTYQDFEIILVDDGSKDSSGDICDKYAKKDNRIHVIHKENGGLSDARNCGLEKADGKYLILLDSDDFLGETALEDTVEVIEKEKSDFVFFDALSFNDEGRDYSIKQNYTRKKTYNTEDGLSVLEKQLKNKEYHSSACMMLIDSDFIKKNHISFYKGILYEDMLFTYELYAKAKKVSQINKSIYHRRYRAESIMTSRPKARNFFSALTVLKETYKFSEYNGITDNTAARLYLSKCAYNAMNIYKRMEKGEQKKEREKYREIKTLCKAHNYFGDKSLEMRCKGKVFWFIYKVITKIFRVK